MPKSPLVSILPLAFPLLILTLITLPAASQATPATPTTTHPAKLPFTISKETTAITQPLLPDGTPDYIGALNARASQGVTPDNNAFVPFLNVKGETYFEPALREKAFRILGIKPPSDPPVVFQEDNEFSKSLNLDADATGKLNNDVVNCQRKLWRADEYPQVAAFIQSQQKVLDLAVECSQRPRWWHPYLSSDDSGRLTSLISPYLGLQNQVAGLLAVRATRAASSGNFDAFLRDTLAIKRLARHAASGTTVTESQTGNSIESTAISAIAATIGAGSFSAAQCDTLSQALAVLPSLPDYSVPFETQLTWSPLEYAMLAARGQLDVFKSSSSTYINTQLYNMLRTIDISAVDWDITLKEIQATMHKVQEIHRDPSLSSLDRRFAGFNASLDAWKDFPGVSKRVLTKGPEESRTNYSRRVAQGICALQGTLPQVANGRRRMLLRQDLLTVLLAAAKFRAQTGDWPDTAESLIPKYLKEIPLDPYSPSEKEPLKYLVNIKTPRVYSVGPDHIDDSGENDPQTKKDDIRLGQ